MPKLTVKAIEAARPRDDEYKLTADRGLYLRVAVDGTKTWIVRFVVKGQKQQQQARLPRPYGNSGPGFMSLAEAVTENAKIQALARDGIDFRVQRAEAEAAKAIEAAKQASLNATFGQMFKAWLDSGVRRKDGNLEITRAFAKDVLPTLEGKPVRVVTQGDLLGVLRAMTDRGAEHMAVRVYRDLVQMFRWASKSRPWRQLLLEDDPIGNLDIKLFTSQAYKAERERTLSASEVWELSNVFSSMEKMYENAPAGSKYETPRPLKRRSQLAIWICLGTLCRIGELLLSRWEHIDFSAGTWFIPKENVKGKKENKREHLIYLNDFSLRQFRELLAIAEHEKDDSPWCFPAMNNAEHLNEKTISKQVGDRQCRFKMRRPLKNRRSDNTLVLANGKNGEWTPHDMRRTGATMMQALRVSLDVIDRCQNHVLDGSKVRRHYLHHKYADEMHEAWRVLGEYIQRVLACGTSEQAAAMDCTRNTTHSSRLSATS